MIQNEHQYKVTQGAIKGFQQAIKRLLEQADTLQPLQVSTVQKSFQIQIDELQAQLQEYDDLEAGKTEIKMGSIASLAL
jgi:flagellar biosynthesis/type III secretory pathway protein FliH